MRYYFFSTFLCFAMLLAHGNSFAESATIGSKPHPTKQIVKSNIPPEPKPTGRDPEKDSVETYKDLTKLLISLATGTIVISTTILGFLKAARIVSWWSLYTSSILLVLSIISGICVFSTLAGSQHANDYNIDYWLTRLFAIPQWLSFVFGLIFMIIFVFRSLKHQSSETKAHHHILDLLIKKEVITEDEKNDVLNKIEQ